jgi:hypothetical protein
MRRRGSIALWVALVAALTLSGCTGGASGPYSTEPMYRQDVRTVAVPIWTRGDSVYRRDLEFRLTEAIVKRLELNTPYRVADKSSADTMLEGQILEVSQRVLSVNPNLGTPRQLQLQLVVAYTWTDLRTGEILVEKPRFVSAGVYSDTQSLDEDFFLGSAEAVNQLAERVVESLEQSW